MSEKQKSTTPEIYLVSCTFLWISNQEVKRSQKRLGGHKAIFLIECFNNINQGQLSAYRYYGINSCVKSLLPLIPLLHFATLICNLCAFYSLRLASSQYWLQVEKLVWDDGITIEEPQLHIQIACFNLCFLQTSLRHRLRF